VLGGYYITGKMMTTRLSGCDGNRDGSVHLRTEATGLAGELDVRLDKEACIKDVFQI
jgi:hypothetical protein